MELPACLLNDKVKNCKNYKYYVQALKEDKVGFLDEVPLHSFMQKKGKKGGKSGSSESSTKSAQKPHKRSLKIRIPVKKPAPEAVPEPTPPSSLQPSNSDTESDSGPVYQEAYASSKQDEDRDMTIEDWDRDINEFVEAAEKQTTFIQRPLTEEDARLEEERLRGEKLKKPMTEEQERQEEANTNLGLSMEEENERALKLGILHSKIDSFQTDQPPPPLFTQPSEAGGSSSIPESTPVSQTQETGTNTEMIVYETRTISPEDVEMHNASEREVDDEEDHINTDFPHLMTMEEMEKREKASEEELKRKQEAEEARLEEEEQAKLEEAIRMEESRKAEEAEKLAEELRLQEETRKRTEEEARLAEELRLKEEADKLAEERRLKAEADRVTKEKEEPKDKPESPKGDDKDTSTYIESSQSSPPASQPKHDESIKKPSSLDASAASNLIKKAVKRVREKKRSKLED
jgi:hypothetical protein